MKKSKEECYRIMEVWFNSGLTQEAYSLSVGESKYLVRYARKAARDWVTPVRERPCRPDQKQYTYEQAMVMLAPYPPEVVSRVLGFLAWRRQMDISDPKIKAHFFPINLPEPDTAQVVAALGIFGAKSGLYLAHRAYELRNEWSSTNRCRNYEL